jgi:hypothetical protein
MGIEVVTEVSCDKCRNRGVYKIGLNGAKKEALESVLSAGWATIKVGSEFELHCPKCLGKKSGYWKKGFIENRGIFFRNEVLP